MAKKKVKEAKTTMVIDARITVIMDGEANEKPDPIKVAEALKKQLDADDVVVKGTKVFVM